MPSRKQLQAKLDDATRELRQLHEEKLRWMYREAALMRVMFQLSEQLEYKRTH